MTYPDINALNLADVEACLRLGYTNVDSLEAGAALSEALARIEALEERRRRLLRTTASIARLNTNIKRYNRRAQEGRR